MFKKLKDKIEEEFKQGPLKFPVSVQQLAQVISPSPSLNSLSDNNPSSSVTYTSDPSNVSTDFFSIGDDDDSQDGPNGSKTLPLHTVDLTAASPSNMTQTRSRRSSLSSVTSEASSLFPIYENPSGQNYFQSDLESEMEDGMPGQLDKISKEQLYQSYKKVFNRYNKYKGRYVDLHKHYKELLHDNVKTKNVLQESQDKALRRIAELKEQCQLEQNAKAHLEESLRNDVEDRDHMITTLKTKISLLRGNGGSGGILVDITDKDGENETPDGSSRLDELMKLKSENESLQKEITDLKKLKDTACHLIHRCDTTIDEATGDVSNENLKRKMSELKGEIQKMKSDNENLSHLLSRGSNLAADEDKKSQSSTDSGGSACLIDLSANSGESSHMDEKDKKIEKLNNLLLKCKEKIGSLTVDIKTKNSLIEEKSKKLKEVTMELETSRKTVADLTVEVEALKVREEENVLSVAENKMAIHKELETKEEQIQSLTKELKTLENEYRKERDETIKKYEDKISGMTEDFTRELKYKSEENEKISKELMAKQAEVEQQKEIANRGAMVRDWETSVKNMLHEVLKDKFNENFMDAKSAEIEKAAIRLQDKLNNVQKNLSDLIQKKQKDASNSQNKLKEVIKNQDKSINELKSNMSAEHKDAVDKLNFEISKFAEKVTELEVALDEKRKALDEAEKTKQIMQKDMEERIAAFESEKEKMRKECLMAEDANKKLNEQLQSTADESCLIEKISEEKNEAESKLREYIDKYKKLEAENEALEKDLNQRCEKLVKDLTDSKERIKSLEVECKGKGKEMEGLRKTVEANKKLLEEKERISQDLQETFEKLKLLEKTRDELVQKCEAMAAEIESLNQENSNLKKSESTLTEALQKLRDELSLVESKVRDVDDRGRQVEHDLADQLKNKNCELEKVQTQLSDQLCSLKALKEELENEKAVSSDLRGKLEVEVNARGGLEMEVNDLKQKHHGLEAELRKAQDECEEEKRAVKQLKESGLQMDSLVKQKEDMSKELSIVSAKVEELTKVSDERSAEVTALKSTLDSEKSENEKLKKELMESEKLRLDVMEKMREVLKEKNDVSDSLQMKLNEMEALKRSLDSAKEELASKVAAMEQDKLRMESENENKLKILKNEIKFMNNKFEEDIGNMEENRSVEVTELSSRLEVAEKTSGELVEKLERITAEKDEAKAAVEERDMKITEMEGCLRTLKSEMDQKFNENGDAAARHQEEMTKMVTRYEAEMMKREEEIRGLQRQLEEFNQVIQNLKSANEKIKHSGIDDSYVDISLKNAADGDVAHVEEKIEAETRQALTAEKESEDQFGSEMEPIESIRRKLIQQTAEMRELKKQHKREVTELRKIISVKRKSRRNSIESPDWGGTLDNDTEHEYLRNILYEYMMGREQLVLAKVLSAIVKFDKQQTQNVLEKEQHRQTLFGQLGIL